MEFSVVFDRSEVFFFRFPRKLNLSGRLTVTILKKGLKNRLDFLAYGFRRHGHPLLEHGTISILDNLKVFSTIYLESFGDFYTGSHASEM
mmetsp:Transcript_17870/g.45341  ORF Transcript_17870/g.45341 Transcript_17870/m.45341 type:complete len:90 (-) Transcript_17870:185-454(-)